MGVFAANRQGGAKTNLARGGGRATRPPDLLKELSLCLLHLGEGAFSTLRCSRDAFPEGRAKMKHSNKRKLQIPDKGTTRRPRESSRDSSLVKKRISRGYERDRRRDKGQKGKRKKQSI